MPQQIHFLDKMVAAIRHKGLKVALPEFIKDPVRQLRVYTLWENESFFTAYLTMTPKERNAFKNWVELRYAEEGDKWVEQHTLSPSM